MLRRWGASPSKNNVDDSDDNNNHNHHNNAEKKAARLSKLAATKTEKADAAAGSLEPQQ